MIKGTIHPRMHNVEFYLFHIVHLCQRSTQEVEGPHSSSQEQPTTQGLWCILRLVALMNLQLQDVGSVVGQKPRQPPHPMQVGTSVGDQTLPSRQQTALRQQQLQVGLSVADQTLPSRQQTAPRQQQLQVGLSVANQTLPSRQQTASRQQQLQVGLSVADQTLPSRQQQLQVDLSVADQKLPTRQQTAPRQQILPSRQQLHHWIR